MPIEARRVTLVDPARPQRPRWHDPLMAAAIALSLSLSIAKATTAPITYDEAYTYLRFATRHTHEILRDYHLPNNHVLHTLLVRTSTRLLGDSTLAIRLPALLGGAAWLVALAAIVRRHLPDFYPAGPASAVLLPMAIEADSLARGYAPGCGFFFVAIWLLLRSADSPRPVRRRLEVLGAGLLFGHSIACVPTYAPLVAGFLLARVVSWFWVRREFGRVVVETFVVALGIAPIVLLYYFHIRPNPRDWPWGHDSLFLACQDLLIHMWGKAKAPPHAWAPMTLFGLLSVKTLWNTLATSRPRNGSAAASLILFAPAALFLFTVIHAFMQVRYPFGRALLAIAPWAWMLIIGSVICPARAGGEASFHSRPITAILVLAVALLSFAEPLRQYADWRDNAAVPAALTAIERDAAGRGATVAIPWRLDVCVEYALRRLPRQNLNIVVGEAGDYRIEIIEPTFAPFGPTIWQDEFVRVRRKASAASQSNAEPPQA